MSGCDKAISAAPTTDRCLRSTVCSAPTDVDGAPPGARSALRGPCAHERGYISEHASPIRWIPLTIADPSRPLSSGIGTASHTKSDHAAQAMLCAASLSKASRAQSKELRYRIHTYAARANDDVQFHSGWNLHVAADSHAENQYLRRTGHGLGMDASPMGILEPLHLESDWADDPDRTLRTG